MRYLSLFSGIEAATVAWEGLGWEAVAFAEIEPFPSRKLAHAYPDVPNLGDVTQITEAQIAALGPIDIVVFGSPCQDLSVAGKRAGLAGARSGLFHTAVEIIQWARRHGGCRWALWENVPGAFSSNAGRDFATVVDLLAGTQCDVPPKGWGTEGVCIGEEALVEWSVLDAQWFGVPQRRRRVFALADFGDWTGRPPILLEPEGMRGDSPPRREAGEGVAGTLAARSSAGGGLGTDFDLDGGLRPCVISMAHGQGGAEISVDRGPTLTCNHEAPIVAHTLKGEGFDASEDGTGRGIPLIAFNGRQDPDSWVDRTGPLDTDGGTQCIAEYYSHDYCNDRVYSTKGVSPALNCSQEHKIRATTSVRRLTPVECERLMGLPDQYTRIDGKTADGPRYKALGNSMAVPVIRWIGQRIDLSDLVGVYP